MTGKADDKTLHDRIVFTQSLLAQVREHVSGYLYGFEHQAFYRALIAASVELQALRDDISLGRLDVPPGTPEDAMESALDVICKTRGYCGSCDRFGFMQGSRVTGVCTMGVNNGATLPADFGCIKWVEKRSSD